MAALSDLLTDLMRDSERLTASRIVKGPNKSIDVEYHGGAVLSRSLGRFPITCPDSSLSSFLHVTQLSFTDWIILRNLVIQNLARILLAVVRTP